MSNYQEGNTDIASKESMFLGVDGTLGDLDWCIFAISTYLRKKSIIETPKNRDRRVCSIGAP